MRQSNEQDCKCLLLCTPTEATGRHRNGHKGEERVGRVKREERSKAKKGAVTTQDSVGLMRIGIEQGTK